MESPRTPVRSASSTRSDRTPSADTAQVYSAVLKAFDLQRPFDQEGLWRKLGGRLNLTPKKLFLAKTWWLEYQASADIFHSAKWLLPSCFDAQVLSLPGALFGGL